MKNNYDELEILSHTVIFKILLRTSVEALKLSGMLLIQSLILLDNKTGTNGHKKVEFSPPKDMSTI